MASSPITSGSTSSIKKHSSRSKKSKHSIADSSALERRSWEAWGQREECIFFDSLVRNSRNWGAIAADIGSKRSEQVRTYYYRVLRKISRLLQAVHFNFDNRDRINTLIALLSFWEAKCETQHEESTIEFAEAIKDRIIRQRQELDTMRSKRHPTPEKLTVQLVPSNDEASAMLTSAGHNPKLQLTLKSKKTMASIVEHLVTKWTASNGRALGEHPLRLYVPDKLGHPGYGVESADVTIVSVFHAMNCPAICRLEYNWNPDHSRLAGGVLAGHEHQELHSTSDEGSDEHSSDSSSMAVTMRHSQRAASPGTHSPSRHSPRSVAPTRPVAVNRLAVPDNVRVSGKPLSEDALDDDAIRHGLLLRKASKQTKPGKPASGSVALSASARLASAHANALVGAGGVASGPRTRSTSPAMTGSVASNSHRATRYSTRSRRGASAAHSVAVEETLQENVVASGYGVSSDGISVSSHGAMNQDHHYGRRYESMEHNEEEEMGMSGSGHSAMSGHLDTISGFMAMDEDLMSEGSPLASVGDMYSSDAGVNELDHLEPMPSVEYGFGGSYIDTPFDGDSSHHMSMMSAPSNNATTMHGRAGSSAHGAHLGVAGLPHSHAPTMVVNHHYYQPTWDHSQSYFLGTAPQVPLDPYYAAYPTSATQTSHPSSTASYQDQSAYYNDYSNYSAPSQHPNARSNYFQYMK